jgi:hypothetical protein
VNSTWGHRGCFRKFCSIVEHEVRRRSLSGRTVVR